MFYVCLSYILIVCVCVHVFLTETSLYLVLHNDSHAIITLQIVNYIYFSKLTFIC